MVNRIWVVGHGSNHRRQEPLYWSDAGGWGSFDQADAWDAPDRDFVLPIEGGWRVTTDLRRVNKQVQRAADSMLAKEE